MQSISDFFKRIGGVHAREIAAREAFKRALLDVVGIDVEIYSISFRSGSIQLKSLSHTAKTAIFTKKAVIIEKANTLQSIWKIQDIK